MEIVKIFVNGKKQGIYAITKMDEVTDAILDVMNEGSENKDYTRAVMETHLKKGLAFIPKTEKPFDWDENIHGSFF
jgi:hypothetical protein